MLRAHVDRVEVVGLDEAYLDLGQFERPKAAARRVKAAIEHSTGLGCSIGIGPSKLVAKVASDAEKPDGFVVLTREQACERFGPSPPGLIPGIGPKTAARLAEQGIDTLAKLGAAPETRSRHGSARGSGPTSAGWRGSSTRARSRPCEWRSRSRARRRSTTTCAASRRSRRCSSGSPTSSARRWAARSGAGRRSASRSGSTTSRRTRARGRSTRRRTTACRGHGCRARAAAGVRPAAAGAAPRRAGRRPGPRRGGGGGPGDDQMALAV